MIQGVVPCRSQLRAVDHASSIALRRRHGRGRFWRRSIAGESERRCASENSTDVFICLVVEVFALILALLDVIILQCQLTRCNLSFHSAPEGLDESSDLEGDVKSRQCIIIGDGLCLGSQWGGDILSCDHL